MMGTRHVSAHYTNFLSFVGSSSNTANLLSVIILSQHIWLHVKDIQPLNQSGVVFTFLVRLPTAKSGLHGVAIITLHPILANTLSSYSHLHRYIVAGTPLKARHVFHHSFLLSLIAMSV
ncbi:hypothetical protein VNO78_17885 [Psophocarpus tetragonolobus]|uniref:Uncharacterized protein n=1 Tax=Psophocarpus tetragonolobus TaxID=3891 RepID=A0AAN9SIG3_PSOTE